MATPLHKPVLREDTRGRLIIIIAPEGLYLREKGRRKTVGPIDYARLYIHAIRAEVDAQRVAKRRNRS